MSTETLTHDQTTSLEAAGYEVMRGWHNEGATERLGGITAPADVEYLNDIAKQIGLGRMPYGYKNGSPAWQSVLAGINRYADEHGLG